MAVMMVETVVRTGAQTTAANRRSKIAQRLVDVWSARAHSRLGDADAGGRWIE
jgi:hypothetical protein